MSAALIEQNRELARAVAGQIKRRCPRHVEFDDLHQFALLGLVDAAQRFDESRGLQFSTFAWPRINGAVRDGMRKMCFNVDEIDDCRAPPVAPVALSNLEQSDVRAALDVLSESERRIVEGSYFQDRTLEDVGGEMGLSKSWASRLRARALSRMRTAITDGEDTMTDGDLRNDGEFAALAPTVEAMLQRPKRMVHLKLEGARRKPKLASKQVEETVFWLELQGRARSFKAFDGFKRYVLVGADATVEEEQKQQQPAPVEAHEETVMSDANWISSADAAKLLDRSTSFVLQLAKTGKLETRSTGSGGVTSPKEFSRRSVEKAKAEMPPNRLKRVAEAKPARVAAEPKPKAERPRPVKPPPETRRPRRGSALARQGRRPGRARCGRSFRCVAQAGGVT